MKNLLLAILFTFPLVVKSQCGGAGQPFFDLPLFYCLNNGNLDLEDYIPDFVSPGVGSFFGTGVSGETFTPSASNPFVTITYVDATGCVFTDVINVVNNCCPITPSSVSIDLPVKYCLHEPLLDLSNYVTIAGGTFYGVGVVGNFFDPAAIQTTYPHPVFTITYEYYNVADNCTTYVHDVIYIEQDCCFDPGSPYVVPSYGGSATALGLTNFTNTDVTILGDFYIDNNFTIDNSLIRLDDHVSITVQSGKTLTITDKSDLFSCNQIVWQGIKLEPGAIIDVNSLTGNSYIQDAETAIYAENDAIVNLINCTFNKNVVGVDLEYNMNQITPYPFFLNGNVTFSNVSSLNSPGILMDENIDLFERSYIGIKAEKTKILNVGDNSMDPNFFNNIGVTTFEWTNYLG